MPKKFKGENSKAAEARARKEEKKIAEATAKKEREEEELWRDDDKHLARKQQRKDEKEKKRLEQLERKKELQKLHDEEMSQLKGAKSHQAKITRAEIEAQRERAAAEAAAAAEKEKSLMHHEMPLEENVNRLQAEGEEARTIEEAISVLSVGGKDEADRHPEKRMKAAYLKFEDDHLPRLKQENPNMRLSQLKHMLKKEWMKSPENPLNQRAVAYNAK